MSNQGFLSRVVLPALLWVVGGSVGAVSSSPVPPQDPEDEHRESLLHRLELGMSALEELGRRDLLEQMDRVVDELREQRRRGSRGPFETLEQRMEVLQVASGALREAERPEAARVLERFHALAELQLHGADAEQQARAAEGLTMEAVIECLREAGERYRAWGWERRAAWCHELAEYYTARERGRVGGEVPPRREGRDLEDRAWRVDVLRFARAAHAEAGDREAAEYLERAIHVGELELTGAAPEEILGAFEGLSMETITHLLLRAAEHYQGWGNGDRASACRSLARHYQERDTAGRAPAPGAEVEVLRRRLAELRAQLEEVQAALERLRDR